MKYLPTFSLILFSLFTASGQSSSLTRERIDRLKKSVVKISIEESTATGTGFFISENGALLTCWHVITPAIVHDSLGIRFRKIFIEMTNGSKIEVGIPLIFFEKERLNEQAVSYDFCILVPTKKINSNFSALKLGDYNIANEGDDIYACGYPLGLPYQFVSKGILSTKFVDTVLLHKNNLPDTKVTRNSALLDLTINKGNSGGPIIRIGRTIDEDVVIGIANFNINPFGSTAELLNNELKNRDNIVLPTGISLTESMKLFSNAIIYSSNGISGCVSINHFLLSTR